MASLAINQRAPFPALEWMSPKYMRRYWGINDTKIHPMTIQIWLHLLLLFRVVFYFKRNETSGEKILKLGGEKRKNYQFDCTEPHLLIHLSPHVISIYCFKCVISKRYKDVLHPSL